MIVLPYRKVSFILFNSVSFAVDSLTASALSGGYACIKIFDGGMMYSLSIPFVCRHGGGFVVDGVVEAVMK